MSTRYSDLLSLVQLEEMFISQVEEKLNAGHDEAVDAEDMAAEMDVRIFSYLQKYLFSNLQKYM